jgi:hypothetical protein
MTHIDCAGCTHLRPDGTCRVAVCAAIRAHLLGDRLPIPAERVRWSHPVYEGGRHDHH